MQCADITTNRFQWAPAGLLVTLMLASVSTTPSVAIIPDVPPHPHARIPSGFLSIGGITSNTVSTGVERVVQTASYFSIDNHKFQAFTAPPSPSFQVRSAIHELRRLSGLTWENLADVLGATRRSLHFWANGSAINSLNEARVRDLLVAIRALDRGNATENRQLLLTPVEDGKTVADLLRTGSFAEAIKLVGRGAGRVVPSGIPTLAKPRTGSVSIADRLGTSPDAIHVDDNAYLPSRLRRRGSERQV